MNRDTVDDGKDRLGRRRPRSQVSGDPPTICGERKIGVRLVAESVGASRDVPREFRQPVLGPTRLPGHTLTINDRSTKAVLFGGEHCVARPEVKQVAKEVVWRRVLVESTYEVRNRRGEIVGPYDGGIQQHRTGGLVYGLRLGRGHSFEHLEVEPPGRSSGGQLVTPAEAPRHVEQIVARQPHPDCVVVTRIEKKLENGLVAGVDFGLRLIRRLLPPMQLGLNTFHRQVRPLDDPYFDPAAAIDASLPSPLAQCARDVVGIR